MAKQSKATLAEKDRSATITIAGKEYELLLTTRATVEIAKRYGSLEAIADKLYDANDMATSLSETIWLIVLLANQTIAIHNIRNKDNTLPYLSTDEVELLTDPYEIGSFKDAIVSAMTKGSKRNIESEENASKNPQDG